MTKTEAMAKMKEKGAAGGAVGRYDRRRHTGGRQHSARRAGR